MYTCQRRPMPKTALKHVFRCLDRCHGKKQSYLTHAKYGTIKSYAKPLKMRYQKRLEAQAMSIRSANSSPPPPWEVLVLVAHHLDPKSLARASCVSKSWYMSISSDHIWQLICTSHYPSFSNLKITHPFVSYHRLYGMASMAAKRRVRVPSMPQFSLDSLIFDIHIMGTKKNHPIIKTAKLGNEFCYDHNGVFRFDFGVNNYECSSSMSEMLEDVKITWNVVLTDWSAVFTMMDYEGKARFWPGSEGWFSQELPSPRCYCTDALSGIVADLKLVFCSKRDIGDKVRVDKVSVGILNVVNWRYVTVEDGIRYLQHFLVAC